jgi:hypothetical protein
MEQVLFKHEYGEIWTETNCTSLFLHVRWNEDVKFTKTVYKQCLDLFGQIVGVLKQEGIDELFSCIPKTDIMALKWQRMFGFEPLIETSEHIIFRGKF